MKTVIFNGNKNIISNRLKEARKQKNISQEDLAARLQVMNIPVYQPTISEIERNVRLVTDYELAAFCKVLQITPEWLLADLDSIIEEAKED